MFYYLLYRLGQFIAVSLPIKSAYRIAVFISDMRSIFAFADRRQVDENLKAIFPEKSDKEIRDIRVRMFRNFAKYLVDFFRFSKLDIAYIKRNVKLENVHFFSEALSRGNGAIALTAHLGNWELGGVVTALLGFPLWAVALEHKDKRVNDFFNHQRESKGLKVIPLGKAVRQCLRLLKENKIVALVGDRDFTARGAVLDFFGKPTYLPEGPAAFALKAQAAIVPGFMVRNPDDTFTLKIEKPIYRDSEDPIELISKYKIIIEDYIRKYPDQWYMFRKFWINN